MINIWDTAADEQGIVLHENQIYMRVLAKFSYEGGSKCWENYFWTTLNNWSMLNDNLKEKKSQR